MSYTAYNGIEIHRNGKWECLVANTPEEIKQLHYYVAGERGYSLPFIDLEGKFDNGDRDFSDEIKAELSGTLGNGETWKRRVVGVMTFEMLMQIRDTIFEEIKHPKHLYKTPKQALIDLLETENKTVQDSITDVFNKLSIDDLKAKGFLDDEYASDNYAELEMAFFAVQYALNLMEHYTEEFETKTKEYCHIS